MENADDDPYASLIIPHCKPTSSQEDKLRTSPFARQSELYPPGYTQSSASEQPTGIIMVSLSDSSQEDYHTPPEQCSSSQNSSNDGQLPPAKMKADCWKAKEGSGGGDGEAMAVDDGCEREGQRTVDLSQDLHNLGFSEKTHTVLVQDSDTVMIDGIHTDQIGNANGVNEAEAETENVTRDDLAEPTGLPTDKTHEVFVEMPLRAEQENTSARNFTKKNIDDIDKFRYVGAKGKRKLPFSLKEGGCGRPKSLTDVLDHASKLLGGKAKGGEEPDFLETAKRRGMTFPRPRWWPPEGFQD